MKQEIELLAVITRPVKVTHRWEEDMVERYRHMGDDKKKELSLTKYRIKY